MAASSGAARAMKGGIAAALLALERSAAIDIRLNVRFVGAVDEEVGFAGATHYVRHHPDAERRS